MSVTAVAAYCVLAAALNSPPGAHATATPADEAAVGVTVTPGGTTTTTIGALAAGKHPAAITTTTVPRQPVIQPGLLRPPHFGTYPIHVVTNGQSADGTLYVGRDGTQRVVVGQAKRATKLRWSATEGDLVRTGEASGDGSCSWNPAAVLIAPNLTEGRSWSSDVTCVTSAGPDTLTIRRQETAKVSRRVRTQVSGQPLDAWLIERHIVTTSRSPGVIAVTEEAVSELFAPQIGLSVYSLSRTDVPRADGGVDSVVESIELDATTPY